jgi:hypothetical protein
VVLEAGGMRYTYHTDEAGNAMRLVAAPALEIKEVTVVWTGAGIHPCTSLIVGREDLAFGPCGGVLMVNQFAPDTFGRRAEDLAYFVHTYTPFEAETPAGKVNFVGQGAVRATPAEQRMIAEWAHWVSVEAAAGRGGASWGLAFAWHREGGIAGFGDDLAVYVTGEVFATSCKGGQPDDLGRGYLTAPQLQQVYGWLDSLQNFYVEHTDPATADAMTVRLVFSGTGAAEPTDADQQAIQDFAAALFARFSNPRVATDVRYVLALQDITMYGGPGEVYDVIGQVFAGQIALVTGVSADGGWWRVICPDDTLGDCWLSSASELTQPTMPTVAEGCPVATAGTQLLVNEAHGYCLLYPTGYSAEWLNELEVVLVVGSLLNVEQPRAYIEVQEAAGRTAAQEADELVADVKGFAIERFSVMVGGEEAVVLESMPGQDTNRQVVIVHNGRLYKLTFVPAGEDYGDVYRQMEDLYATVIPSWNFFPRNSVN